MKQSKNRHLKVKDKKRRTSGNRAKIPPTHPISRPPRWKTLAELAAPTEYDAADAIAAARDGSASPYGTRPVAARREHTGAAKQTASAALCSGPVS